MVAKSIAQWAKDLVNEDNVKLCILLTPDASNPTAIADAVSGWIVYSGSL